MAVMGRPVHHGGMTAEPTPAIQLQQLRYAWPQQPALLDIATFTVQRGERVFLHGPSGSGKSTLLGLLGGVLQAASGSVSVLGQNFTALSAAQRDHYRAAHIGFIFQQFNLLPYLPVIDNVLLPLRFSKERRLRVGPDERALVVEARRLLAELGLSAAVQQQSSVMALSHGQQQRVAAARALIGRPGLLIADEPTSALDADAREAFLQLLMTECRSAGTTLIFVSHDRTLGALFDRQVSLQQLNRVGA
jgi:putative ABC transport system ATP-binding protein